MQNGNKKVKINDFQLFLSVLLFHVISHLFPIYFPFISHLFPIYFPFISLKYPKVLYVVTLLPSGGAQGGPRGSGARGARAAFDAPHAAREVGFGDGKMG